MHPENGGTADSSRREFSNAAAIDSWTRAIFSIGAVTAVGIHAVVPSRAR